MVLAPARLTSFPDSFCYDFRYKTENLLQYYTTEENLQC